MYSFLMIGQSNMAGRGFKGDVLPIKNERLHVLRNGRWQPLDFPVNHDRSFSGITLAESFADQCSEYYNTDIGLIPCADGGTVIAQWQPGEILFDNAVFQAKLAQRTSVIAGVLWHQGESDCKDDCWPYYGERCIHVFESIKKELNLSDDVPFIVGGLGDFLAENKEFPYLANYTKVDSALQSLAANNNYIGYVSVKGLTSNPDYLHFNAKSLRILGNRYFEKFKEMNKVIRIGQNDAFKNILTEMEKL